MSLDMTTPAASTGDVGHDFDPFAPDYLADPYPILDALRERVPVFYAPALDMWVVTRFAEIDEIFRNPARFSAANAQDPIYPLAPEARQILADAFRFTPSMSNCDPPKHTRIRAHNVRAFSARRMALLEPTIGERTRELVDRMLRASPADFIADLAFPLPALTIFTLVGFPDEDAELLKSWCGNRMAFSWGRPSPGEQAEIARNMVSYWRYCERFVAGRLADPRDDFASDLARIHLADASALGVEEITSVVYGLSFAGHETTTNLLGNTIRQLLTHRDQWDALCADPTLIPNAVEEVLRLDTSVVAWRRVTTEPVTIGGVSVPQGAKLMLLLAAAGHDPRHYVEPDQLDVRRANARDHIAFGKGIHFCLGAALARLQVKIVLEDLTVRVPTLRSAAGQHFEFHPNISFRGPRRLWVDWDA
jgi:cytochrome P450